MSRGAPIDPVAFHSDIAAAFDASYAADPNRLERIEVWRACLDRYTTHVLVAYDIGCGAGALTVEIAPRADAVIAIDGAEGMLALAKRNVATRGFDHVKFLQARLPIVDASRLAPAQLVIASSVIEYLPSLPDALAMLVSLMAPGATLMFSISNKSSISRAVVRAVHRITGRPRYLGLVLHFVTAEQIKALLEGAGLDLVDLRYFGGADRTNRALAQVFPIRFAANMILVVARRPG